MAHDRQQQQRYERDLHGELQGAATYEAMAEVEKDPERADVFRRLAEAEMRHATSWATKMGLDPVGLKPARGGVQLRMLKLAARLFGTNRIMPILLKGEAEDIRDYSADPEALSIAKEERSHGRTLRSLAGLSGPLALLRGETQHFTGSSGSLRAAVLGVSDGLASNFARVMGVAGGTGDAQLVTLVGVAGLLAGAFSMAAGEYVSMSSQREIHEHQIELERTELAQWPEEEEAELALLYQAKGIPREDARRIAAQIIVRPEAALDTLVREELGLDPRELGSPWGASLASFTAFAFGAFIPLGPYLIGPDRLAFAFSAAFSAGALLLIGGILGLVTGRSIVRGGLRMLLVAGAAATVTYGVGWWVGGALLG